MSIGIQLKPSERLGIERFQELSGKVRCQALVPCLLLRKSLNLQALCPALMNLAPLFHKSEAKEKALDRMTLSRGQNATQFQR
ncbi:hypothetical protein Ancab_039467 [Ancistrocladus abbreviatus]